MSAWSDFLKDYCAKTGVTYTVASKDPAVKILYKEWKASMIDLEIVEEEAKEAKEEAKLEEVKEEFKEAEPIVLEPEPIAPPPATPIFISKKRRI